MSPLSNRIQREAYRLVYFQLAGIATLALLITLFSGLQHGLSVVLGGFAYGLPNLIFVWRVFRYAGAQQMNKFMVAFYFGEALKLILSGILFVLVVKTLPVSLLSVLAGFITAIVSFWIACLWQFSRQK